MVKLLHQLSVGEIREAYLNGELTCVGLVEHLLKRIDRHNPKLNIFLSMNDRAMEEAMEVDEQIAIEGHRIWDEKPLLGIPIAVKDNFLTKGMVTTASSKVLESYRPHYESTVTQKLKDAGAIIIGKTNMDAWAHGSSTETSQFGPTLNPWDTSRLPGGSSGGSAAAVAAELVPLAIGSETAGSIRQPAAWCGVVGLKPTYGRVSRYGVIAMASSTDSPGVLSRNVDDAALVFKVVAGHDPKDATSSPTPLSHMDFNKEDLKGIKIGIVKEYLGEGVSETAKEAVMKAAGKVKELGATVEEVSLLDPRYAIGVYTILQRSEVSSNLARFDGIRYGNGRENFGEESKRRIMLGTYALSAGYYDAYYKKALKVRTEIVKEFEKVFKEYDLLIGPVSPGPALKVGSTKNQPMFGEIEDRLVEASSIAGLPGISVPMGFENDMPLGLQITGKQFDEEKVMQAAKLFQEHTDYQHFPKLNDDAD